MKIPVDQVIQEQIDSDIWSVDEMSWWLDEYREDHWDGVHSGEMSWQWYMKLDQHQDWHLVKISPAHKNITVATWLKNEYPGIGFEYEQDDFIIEDSKVAMMVALKFS